MLADTLMNDLWHQPGQLADKLGDTIGEKLRKFEADHPDNQSDQVRTSIAEIFTSVTAIMCSNINTTQSTSMYVEYLDELNHSSIYYPNKINIINYADYYGIMCIY